MEKITIKINHVALQELCFFLEIQSFAGNYKPEQKVVMSIMHELSKKLETKEINKRHTVKKFKMTFLYYEAFALERFCRQLYNGYSQDLKPDPFLVHVLLDVANQIDKQL